MKMKKATPQRLKYLVALFSLLAIISGCGINIQIEPKFASETLKPGMTLELTKEIFVPSNTAFIFIQNGMTISEAALDQYNPYCKLEMKKPINNNRTLTPSRFVIINIYTQTEYVLSNPVKIAARGTPFGTTTADEIYSTILIVKSDENPEVEKISCEYWRDPTSFEGHLTEEQIQETLKGLFNLIS